MSVCVHARARADLCVCMRACACADVPCVRSCACGVEWCGMGRCRVVMTWGVGLCVCACTVWCAGKRSHKCTISVKTSKDELATIQLLTFVMSHSDAVRFKTMMMISFNTFNSSLVPLIEDLCGSNPCAFEFLGLRDRKVYYKTTTNRGKR